MRKFVVLVSFLVASLVFGQSGVAQTLRSNPVPAEIPPTSFTGNQYIDSDGCVFIRAGVSGAVQWIPRVSRSRTMLCGFQPTFANVTAPELPVVPDPPAVAASAAPQLFEQPVAPARNTAPVGPPIETVASTAPLPVRQPVTAPPVVAAAVPVPEISAPPVSTLTRAQLCAGKSGIQAGFISSRTGQPINCGPAPIVAAAQVPVAPTVAPTVAPARLTRAQLCTGRTGIQQGYIGSRTGLPIDCGGAPAPQTQIASASTTQPRTDQPRTVSRAEICREIAATGRNYINAATGLPVQCTGSYAPVVTPIAPIVAPPIALAGATFCTGGNAISAPFYGRGEGERCGPQTQSPSGITGLAGSTARTSTRSTGNFLAPAVVPASNPPVGTPVAASPPPGYRPVWDDGRLNPNRGLPRNSAATGWIVQPNAAPRVSSRTVSPRLETPAQRPELARVAAANLRGFVQIGTFAERSNAQQVAQGLRAKGLPMSIGIVTRGGSEYRVVLAGPFISQAQLNRALQTARRAGFTDAYVRQ